MSPYISGFLIFLIISLFLGAFFSLLYTDKLKLNDESLDKQPLFWFAVLSPIVLFLIFGVIIWKDYIPDLSGTGLDKFAQISKFPLAALALSPIFGVIVSNIHRTIQTKKQIQVTEIKNISDGFYSHNKYIIEEFKSIEYKNNQLKMLIDSPNKLYKRIYPASNVKNGYSESINEAFISTLNKKCYDLRLDIEIFTNFLNDVNSKTDSKIILSNIDYAEIVYLSLLRLMKECHINIDDGYKSYFYDNQSKCIKDINVEVQDFENHLKNEIIAHANISALVSIVRCVIFCLSTFSITLKKIFDVINLEDSIEQIELKDFIKNDLKNSYLKILKLQRELYQPIGEAEAARQHLAEQNQNS